MIRVLLGLLLACAAAAQRKPVTLEVAARPATPEGSPGTPVWSPDGNSFVYLAGKTLWRFDATSGQKRSLGSIEPLEKAAAKEPENAPFRWENRRVVDEKIQWTPSGDRLVLYAGGDLFLWTIGNSHWVQLTRTPEPERNPKLSPDGRLLSFARGNELHVLDLETRKVRQLTTGSSATLWNGRLDWVYPEELDLGTAHWWSPDSQWVAFLQFDVSREWIYPRANLLEHRPVYEPQRYPKAGTPNADVRLGVVPARGGPVKWMRVDATSDGALLARVDWLPDSRRIAVQRLNRVQNELMLLFVDAATGAAKPVLTERSPYWVNVSHDLRLLTRRPAFLWSSEKDGYRHLYLHDYGGRELKRLTSGSWEVKSIAGVDEERGLVYFHSRQRSPLGVDLAAVPLEGGEARLITSAKGQHAASLSPNGRFFIDTYSSLTQPASKVVRRITGEETGVLQPEPSVAAEFDLLPWEIVSVPVEADVLYARLLKPAGFDPSRRYPAIVMVYGGPHAQNVCDCWSGAGWEQALAHRGFVVWQLDNRGTAGRGLAWEARLYRRLGKQELSDQEAGIRHLLSMGFVDASRIGLYGWSYGGFLTLYTLLNSPDLVRAGIAGAPVTDWRDYDTIYTERYLGLPSENEEGYRLSSPVHRASNLKAALLLVHNYGDDNVLFQQSFRMMVELQKAGKPFETAIYPQRSHGVTGAARRHLLETMTAFFERHLK